MKWKKRDSDDWVEYESENGLYRCRAYANEPGYRWTLGKRISSEANSGFSYLGFYFVSFGDLEDAQLAAEKGVYEIFEEAWGLNNG